MSTQKRIEQYLNRATRGLWGRKRLEVRNELYSHIYEKMHFQMSFGKSETEALESTLQALGHAREVNAGLLKTHALPASLKAAFIAGLLGTVLVTQAQNLKVMEVFNRTPPCISSAQYCASERNYIQLTELAPLLAQLDITADFRMEGLLQQQPQLYLNGENIHLPPGDLLGDAPQTAAVNVSNVLHGLYQNRKIRVSGLMNPQIELDGSVVRFENKQTPYDASEFYLALMAPVLYSKVHSSLLLMDDASMKKPSRRITVRTPGAKDGEVYGLIQKPEIPVSDGAGKTLDVRTMVFGEVKNGQVELYANYDELKPVALEQAQSGDVFLKLSGDPAQPLYSEIFPRPEDITRHF